MEMETSKTVSAEQAPLSSSHHARNFARHVADLATTTFVMMKLPLAFIFALMAIVFMATASLKFTISRLHSELPSLCDLPVISRISPCVTGTSIISPTQQLPPVLPHRADFPSLINIQDSALDQLVEQSASGLELALNVKHAEVAVQDLVAVVRLSNLPSTDVLANALADFAIDARDAGRSLQRLTGKMQTTIDSIMSYNEYALRTIDEAKARGSTSIDATVLRTFQASMNKFSSEVTRVIVEATTAMSTLDRLDGRLASIHDLCVSEALVNAIALDSVLWELWTLLGGNQDKVRDLRHRAAVLQEVHHYRSVAVAYVTATTQMLYAIDTELSELRDRLTGYTIDSPDIPVEVHLASIERSVLRLQGTRASGEGRRLDAAT